MATSSKPSMPFKMEMYYSTRELEYYLQKPDWLPTFDPSKAQNQETVVYGRRECSFRRGDLLEVFNLVMKNNVLAYLKNYPEDSGNVSDILNVPLYT